MAISIDGGGWLLLFFGPITVMKGLRSWRLKRLMEDIPSSKVRSAAIGRVEMWGMAKPKIPLQAPFSGRDCCWWRCQVQEFRREGKSSRWVTIKTMNSVEPFFLEDETGRMLVDPLGADMHVSAQTIQRNGLTAQAHAHLAAWGVPVETFLGFSRDLRFLEQTIENGFPIYTLGELSHRNDFLAGRANRLRDHLRVTKQDAQRMKAADANQDGRLDLSEWDAFRVKLEEDFLARERALSDSVPEAERIVLKLPNDGPYIISTGHEEDLRGRLRWKAPLELLLGLVMTGAGVWTAQVYDYAPLFIFGILAASLVSSLFFKSRGITT